MSSYTPIGADYLVGEVPLTPTTLNLSESFSAPRGSSRTSSGSSYSEDDSVSSSLRLTSSRLSGHHHHHPHNHEGRRGSKGDAHSQLLTHSSVNSAAPAYAAHLNSYVSQQEYPTVFSLSDELHYCAHMLRQLWKTIDEDRLPWKRDFMDLRKMRMPRNAKEALGRLSLNIPYYASNYLVICYLFTLSFLFFYDTMFFAVMVAGCVLVHSIAIRRKHTNLYGNSVTVFKVEVPYRTCAHLLVGAGVLLFMFFDGLRTLLVVIALNTLLVVPHALLRRTTYFDDEDMEKTRPKLFQYFVALVLLILAYLEGDREEWHSTDPTLNENARMAREERIRLGILERNADKDEN